MSTFQNTRPAPTSPTAASDEVVCWLNGERVTVQGDATLERLSSWLRTRRRLTGTKVACGTGDCGSCTVLVAGAHENPPRWLPVNACLGFVYQFHGSELRTIEGIGAPDWLTPLQEAMVHSHGAQCGVCTPGIVMAATAVMQDDAPTAREQWARCLSGNVCRCTGYTAIIDAAIHATVHATTLAEHSAPDDRPAHGVPPFTDAWLAEREALRGRPLAVGSAGCATDTATPRTIRPVTLAAAIEALVTAPHCVVTAGTTDLALDEPPEDATWLDIGQLQELRGVDLLPADPADPSARDVLVLGALTTWQELASIAGQQCPPLAALLQRMGGPQVRARATVGGNVMTASPIGDLLPLLYVLETHLEFTGPTGSRQVSVREAITGYRTVQRGPAELLTRVRVALPHAHEKLALEKVSRRRDMDIAALSLAAWWARDASGRVRHVALAAGGVGPTVLRLTDAERRLNGSPGAADDWREAAALAVHAIEARTDVRGSATYRRQVLANLITSLATFDGPSRGTHRHREVRP